MKFNKTRESIRQELFAEIENRQIEYFSKGWLPTKLNLNRGIVRGILEIVIYGFYLFYQVLDNLLDQVSPNKATGTWLDIHCDDIGIKRKIKTKAKGYVQFIRDKDNSSNIKIAIGKIVGTKTDGNGKRYRYIIVEEVTMKFGTNSIFALVESEDYGMQANASIGQINELITPIEGIASITNETNWIISEGTDDERDEDLRSRYTATWQRTSGVVAEAYRAVCLSVNGVVDIYVDDQHPTRDQNNADKQDLKSSQGAIDIYVLGTADEPTDELLKMVAEKLKSEIIINDDVKVKSVKTKYIDIAFMLELVDGNGVVAKASAENFVRDYFKAIKIGEDIIRDRIASNIINIQGVKQIVWSDDISENIEVLANEIARLRNITITTDHVMER